jgi:general secretion pathway protein G
MKKCRLYRLAKHDYSRGLRTRGFTLPEILIAVAIIGVLGTIALPSYASYRERVLITQAMIDISEMDERIKQYRKTTRKVPADLSEVGLAGKLDPWGQPYQYEPISDRKGGAAKFRKDKKLTPISTDFDLYSMGHDGQSAPALTAAISRDDIVRASDGRFVGLASDFDP